MPVKSILPTFATLAPWQHSLLEWIGVDFSRSPENAQAELLWTNLPASWGVFVLIAVVGAVLYAVFWLYRRELDSAPRWGKLLLAGLRAGVSTVRFGQRSSSRATPRSR